MCICQINDKETTFFVPEMFSYILELSLVFWLLILRMDPVADPATG